MSFLTQNEHIIFMDVPTRDTRLVNEDDLRQLRDAGVETALLFYNRWGWNEVNWGIYDLDRLEKRIALYRKVGLKGLIMSYNSAPSWFPPDWFAKNAAGHPVVGVLSPWNKEAQDYSLKYLEFLCGRYNTADTMIINGQLEGGETIMVNEAAFYDDAALKDFADTYAGQPTPNEPLTEEWVKKRYIDMMVKQQRVLIQNKDREIWCMLHPAIAMMGLYGNGNKWIGDVLNAYRLTFPDANINHLLYTWIQFTQVWAQTREWSNKYLTNMFGGSGMTEGYDIAFTAGHAIEQGLRGLIAGPCHEFTGRSHVEPWMTADIKKANQEFILRCKRAE